jgi:hypothetical protein
MVGNVSSGILMEVFTTAFIVLGSMIKGAKVCERSFRKTLLLLVAPKERPPRPVRDLG